MPEILTRNHHLLARILAGAAVLAVLALLDLRKCGRSATRWREYAFLLGCVTFACGYGALNDQASVTLSWEYFYYGKELSASLGADTPPAQVPLRLRAAIVGMQATWSAGLLIGAGLLIANNRWRSGRPQLPYRRLASQLPVIAGITAILGALGAAAGYLGALTWLDTDFRDMLSQNLWRPHRFIAAWGEHLGSYAGGLLGLTVAICRVLRERRRI